MVVSLLTCILKRGCVYVCAVDDTFLMTKKVRIGFGYE